MKTKNQNTGRLPGSISMILHIAAVAAIGLLNCYLSRAADPENPDYAERLEAAFEIQAEPVISIEDWMLDPAYFAIPEYLIVEKEEEAVLEDWMLDAAYFAVPEYLVLEKEEKVELEDWMLDTGRFVTKPVFMAKSDR
jgi:hypothetical protein